jgi:hypothetical protein
MNPLTVAGPVLKRTPLVVWPANTTGRVTPSQVTSPVGMSLAVAVGFLSESFCVTVVGKDWKPPPGCSHVKVTVMDTPTPFASTVPVEGSSTVGARANAGSAPASASVRAQTSGSWLGAWDEVWPA